MKKVLLSVFITLATVVALPMSAAAAPAVTEVTGYVTYSGSNVNRADVVITCNGYQKTTHTNASGAYRVAFGTKKCPDGSSVAVSATMGSESGSATGTAGEVTTKLNVALVNVVFSVPELGAVTASIAAAAAGAAFFVIRRRSVSQN